MCITHFYAYIKGCCKATEHDRKLYFELLKIPSEVSKTAKSMIRSTLVFLCFAGVALCCESINFFSRSKL